jgi:NAD(P)-dependent dehydrogenase (short-subunit alcohol dehydrogenase family)
MDFALSRIDRGILMDKEDFGNKVALVTGASSGIGKASAIAFARQGAAVVIVGRRAKELRETASIIRSAAALVKEIVADVTKEEDRSSIIKQTLDAFGGIDILVNAAGIIGSGTIENTTLANWDYMLDINVRSVFRLIQSAMPYLVERKGNVINVSSVAGLRSFPGIFAYCVSKAAVDQLTRCAALELASKGVRVNAVNPGVVVTNLHRAGGMDEETYSQFLERSKQTHPLGRAGQAEEVAELILFLASPTAGWITGCTYSIDGGRAQTCAR